MDNFDVCHGINVITTVTCSTITKSKNVAKGSNKFIRKKSVKNYENYVNYSTIFFLKNRFFSYKKSLLNFNNIIPVKSLTKGKAAMQSPTL